MSDDTLVDYITGKTVANVGAEANRQAVERFLVQKKGYRIERFTRYRNQSGFIWAVRA